MCQLQYFCITPQHKTIFLSTNPCQATVIGYIWEVRFNQEAQGFQLGSCMNDCFVCWTKCICHLSIAFIHTAVWYGKITQDAHTTQGRKGKMLFWYKNTFKILLISIQFQTINRIHILNNFTLHTQNMDNKDEDFSPAVVVYVSF